MLVHYDHLWVILINLLHFVAEETLVLALFKLEADSWKTELPLEQKVEQLLPRRYSVIGLVSCFVQGSYGVQSCILYIQCFDNSVANLLTFDWLIF